MSELLARVEANLRRARKKEVQSREVVTAGPLVIDLSRKEAFVNGESLGLTGKELAVLHLLASKAPQVVSRDDIYRAVWGYELMHGDRSVDVFVRRIRKKLGQKLPGYSFLHTHYGFGYKFEVRETGGENSPGG